MHRLPALPGRKGRWVLGVLIMLVAAHGVILRYLLSNVTVSAALLSGAVVLLVVKHLGLLGSLYAAVRRRSRSE